jgi:hypothetical protein
MWQSNTAQSPTTSTWTARTGWVPFGPQTPVGITANADGSFTVAQAGLYQVNGVIGFAFNATGRRLAGIYTSLVAVAASAAGQAETNGSASPVNTSLNVSTTVRMAAGDVLTLQGWQSSGGNLAFTTAGACMITITRLAEQPQAPTTPTLPTAYCRIQNNAQQAFVDGTATGLVFNVSDSRSTPGMADLANNRIVIPYSGLYCCEAHWWMAGATTTYKLLQMLVNGVRIRQFNTLGIGVTAGVPLTAHEWLTAGDVLTASVTVNGQALSSGVFGGYSAQLDANLLRV